MRQKKAAATSPPRKVAFVLRADLRRRLKLYMADKDVRQQEVLNESVDEYLRKRGA